MSAGGMRVLPARRLADVAVLAAGIAAFCWVLAQYVRLVQLPAWTIDPVDLVVYRDAGLIVRHAPRFRAALGPDRRRHSDLLGVADHILG